MRRWCHRRDADGGLPSEENDSEDSGPPGSGNRRWIEFSGNCRENSSLGPLSLQYPFRCGRRGSRPHRSYGLYRLSLPAPVWFLSKWPTIFFCGWERSAWFWDLLVQYINVSPGTVAFSYPIGDRRLGISDPSFFFIVLIDYRRHI